MTASTGSSAFGPPDNSPGDYTPAKNKGYIGEGMTELYKALLPYVSDRMRATHGVHWRRAAVRILKRHPKQRVPKTFDRDLNNLLRLMRDDDKSFMALWHLGAETLLNKLLAFRNQWAHEWDIDALDTLHVHELMCKVLALAGLDDTAIAGRRDALRAHVAGHAPPRGAGPFVLPPPSPQLFAAAPPARGGSGWTLAIGSGCVAVMVIMAFVIWPHRKTPSQPPPIPRPAETPNGSPARPARSVGVPASGASAYLSGAATNQAWVLIADASRSVDADLTDLVATALRGTGSAFLPAFVQDGEFHVAWAGDSKLLRRLGIASVPTIVLGEEKSEVSREPLVDQAYWKATTTLTVRVYTPSSGFVSRGFVVEGIGPGFSADVARRAADRAAVTALVARLNESNRSEP